MTDDFANELPRRKSNPFVLLLLAATAAFLFGWLIKGLMYPPSYIHPSIGKPMPVVEAEGWINGPPPAVDELTGKVIVFEAWEYWCGPCLAAAPHTVELYNKYKEQGVVFVGLSSEPATKLAQSQQFVQRAKFTWPCAYGVSPDTLTYLYETESIAVPAMWVVDRQGTIVWGGHPMALKEELLDELLKK